MGVGREGGREKRRGWLERGGETKELERERECVFHVPNHISKFECRTNEINDYEKNANIHKHTNLYISLSKNK